MAKKILLITDYFPPDGGGRSEKIGRRAKYLRRNGWDVTVLAPKTPESQKPWLAPEDLRGIKVVRTDYFFSKRWPSLKHNKQRFINESNQKSGSLLDFIFVPKGYIRWFFQAVAAGVKQAKQADLIVSINNPIMLHLIGWVVSRLSGKPWAAELRDPIAGYAYSRRGPEIINRFLEKIVMYGANRVIQWTDIVPVQIKSRFPAKIAEKIQNLEPVGFDPDLFRVRNGQRPPDVFTLSYTGSFYGTSIVPDHILQAAAQCVRQLGLAPGQMKLIFAGDWSPRYDQMVADLGLQGFVDYVGMVSVQACFEIWQNSSVLLLMLGDEEEIMETIPTKLWDYVAARRPILCLAPQNSRVARLIRDQKAGYCVEPFDGAGITAVMREMYEQHLAGQLGASVSDEFVEYSSCANSERKFSNFLAELVTQ